MPTAVINLTADGYYRLTAGSTEYTKLLSDDGDTSYLASIASPKAWTFIADDSPGGALSVQAVRAKIKFALTGSTNAYGPAPRHRYAGADYDGMAADDQIAGAGYRMWTYTLTPPTGGWTPAVVSQTEFGFVIPADTATGQFRVTYFYVEIDYQGAGLRAENAREVAARMLLLGRRPVQTVDLDGPLALADVLPGQIISLSHEEGASDAVDGWGPDPWKRRPVMVLRSSVEPAGMRAKVRALDVMQYIYLRSLWRTMRTKEAFSPDQQGAIKLDVGDATEFLRDSQAWVQNPPDGVWKRAEKNVERVGLDGTRIEPARINAQPYPSFNTGYGTGGFYAIVAGSGAVANDSSILWFDPEIIQYSLKMSSHATAHTVATTVAGTATAAGYYAINALVTVSVYHLEDFAASAFLAVRIIRTIDGRYWNDAASTWDVAVVDNPIPASLSRDIWRSKMINVGATATGLQLVFAIPAGATAAKNAWVFHVQHEAGTWASSPIAGGVDATPITRAGDTLRVYTSNPPHVWPVDRGACGLEFIPDWDGYDPPSSLTLLSVAHGAGDRSAIYWDPGATAWVFEHIVSGTAYRASFVPSSEPLRGERWRIVARWCSALGEWEGQAYRLDIWAGLASAGVTRQTSPGNPPGLPVPLATRSLYIGGGATTDDQAGGQISNVWVSPLCLPDYMIKDIA